MKGFMLTRSSTYPKAPVFGGVLQQGFLEVDDARGWLYGEVLIYLGGHVGGDVVTHGVVGGL